ncbi:MAG: preprotein translocase subunit YajC [Gemmatimonadetes bacterium]|nr:preprotein translocase subunit YajC [Gemmatimonadota bacterium]
MNALLPIFAQTAVAAGGTSSLMPFLFQLGAIMAIFYFLMIRPQQKQRKQLEESILALHKGDNVVTTGGVVGEVVHIKESIDDGKPSKGMDDLVTIRTGEVKIVVERRSIARVASSGSATAA